MLRKQKVKTESANDIICQYRHSYTANQ